MGHIGSKWAGFQISTEYYQIIDSIRHFKMTPLIYPISTQIIEIIYIYIYIYIYECIYTYILDIYIYIYMNAYIHTY